MKWLAPVLFLTLAVAACDNDGTPVGPRPDLPDTVAASPIATVPARPEPTPVPDSPPTQVIKFNPHTASGSVPFELHVNQCLSTGPLAGFQLMFTYDYGDGTQKSGRGLCRTQHTYQRAGNFRGVFCVGDTVPGHTVCTHQTIPVS
jgi:hypothetical protein